MLTLPTAIRHIDKKELMELLAATEGNQTSLEGVQFPQWEQLANSRGRKVLLK